MITMPISYYPASSDDNAQIQVMHERRGEIARQMQDVQESGLDEYRKRAITDKLKVQSENLNKQIDRKQAEREYKAKLSEKNIENKFIENKSLEKQSADYKAKLDTNA